MHNIVRVLLLLATVQNMVAGCAANTVLVPFDKELLVWPAPPDIKRVAFVGEFANSSDLGIEPGIWSKIISFSLGANDDSMVRPMAVAVTADGSVVFVADPGARCVHRYDMRRARYTCLTGNKGETLVSPVGLAITNEGRLFVADSQAGRLFQVAVNGKRLEPFDVGSKLQQPTGIFWDENSNLLYVTDTGRQSIKVFDPSGVLVREFSERGDLPGQVNYPTYLWLDDQSELLLTDTLNFRVQRFTANGDFLSAFGEHGDQAGSLARPKGIAVDSFGHIYVIDAVLHSMQIFDRLGALLLSIGERGQLPGQFWLPNGIFISKDNRIFVADSYNKRIQVFRYVGLDP